jgi:SpoIID/LytB domain protein
MTVARLESAKEPVISVGLIEGTDSVTFHLRGNFTDRDGTHFPPGEYVARCRDGVPSCTGGLGRESNELVFVATDKEGSCFTLEATIGIDFHWQRRRRQSFRGNLRLIPRGESGLTVINDVPLETYVASVICSEMAATSPLELVKAHGVISRSWVLAQLEAAERGGGPVGTQTAAEGEMIRWYDREAHTVFDVCADDHCQRYQGIGGHGSAAVRGAIRDTRGMLLTCEGRVCDARFSKCCGGVTEDSRVAWGEEEIPYLSPVFDGPGRWMPTPPLTEEDAMRGYIEDPPQVYCRCSDLELLDNVMTSYDRETADFFRWRRRLSATSASQLVREKLHVDVGRLLCLEPVERGLSGRLSRLRLTGELGSVVVGKELEIRRILSPSHLYSSAFVVDTEGPAARPEGFVLSGAGWGHGVGFCQIGAAVMASRGIGYEDILKHYYRGTEIERFY